MSDLIFLDAPYRSYPDWELRHASIVIDEGKITLIGSAQDARKHAAANAQVLELPDGVVLYPGVVDAHAHVQGTGERLLRPRLEGLTSIAQIVEKLRPIAKRAKIGEWVIARGWDQEKWQQGGELPTYQDLAPLGDVPVVLTRVDGHALWCNEPALQIAGITRGTHDPVGGVIHRDVHGEATGILLDEAMKLVEQQIPQEPENAIDALLDAGLKHFARMGHVAAHDMGVSAEVFERYRYVYDRSSADLPHAWVFLDMHKHSARQLFREIVQDRHIIPPHPSGRLHFAGIKLYLDGALGSRGASLFEPYTDAPDTSGIDLLEDREAIELMKIAGDRGLQIAVHAIGDKANARALSLFEHAGVARRNATLRIEHAQIVRHSDLKRFEKLGVHAVVQPAFYESDHGWAPQRLGNDRIADAYRWASFLRHEVNLVASSDSPIESPDAIHGMELLVHRCGKEDTERLTASEAMTAYMHSVHHMTRESELRGRIQVGFAADFTAIREHNDGPKSASSAIAGTMIDGRWIYSATPQER